jgi:hypothetical protein
MVKSAWPEGHRRARSEWSDAWFCESERVCWLRLQRGTARVCSVGCRKPCESMGDQSLSGRQVAPGKPVECSDGSVGFETIKERDTDGERGHETVSRKDAGRIGW